MNTGTFWVFKRSARNWKEFAEAPKRVVETGLTYDEARELCATNNAKLSESEQERGTKYEFTAGNPES